MKNKFASLANTVGCTVMAIVMAVFIVFACVIWLDAILSPKPSPTATVSVTPTASSTVASSPTATLSPTVVPVTSTYTASPVDTAAPTSTYTPLPPTSTPTLVFPTPVKDKREIGCSVNSNAQRCLRRR